MHRRGGRCVTRLLKAAGHTRAKYSSLFPQPDSEGNLLLLQKVIVRYVSVLHYRTENEFVILINQDSELGQATGSSH